MSGLITRKIPSTGERLPAIGLGSWQTFDVDDARPLQPIMERFLTHGGRVVDSSPMYGRSEAAIGAMLRLVARDTPTAPKPFLATKVWTKTEKDGVAQMKRSMTRMGASQLDLMQIHNLVDWRTHLKTLRAWKADATIRYIGITHYAHAAFGDLETIMNSEPIDFVQLPYSVVDREAEARLLPLAADRQIAVLVMEPFASGKLFDRVKGKALPTVAGELGCTSWAQLFLKFVLGHPAVTCPIPATSNISHLDDNMGALRGAVPDADQRKRIVAALSP